jgi:hypothetical protein
MIAIATVEKKKWTTLVQPALARTADPKAGTGIRMFRSLAPPVVKTGRQHDQAARRVVAGQFQKPR